MQKIKLNKNIINKRVWEIVTDVLVKTNTALRAQVESSAIVRVKTALPFWCRWRARL